MKNTTLKAQLEALHDIGLDRVNAAVAAVFVEIADLEDQFTLEDPNIERAKEAALASLREQNTLLRAELVGVRNAIANPTPADAVPSP